VHPNPFFQQAYAFTDVVAETVNNTVRGDDLI
jgi:hypothetical protein